MKHNKHDDALEITPDYPGFCYLSLLCGLLFLSFFHVSCSWAKQEAELKFHYLGTSQQTGNNIYATGILPADYLGYFRERVPSLETEFSGLPAGEKLLLIQTPSNETGSQPEQLNLYYHGSHFSDNLPCWFSASDLIEIDHQNVYQLRKIGGSIKPECSSVRVNGSDVPFLPHPAVYLPFKSLFMIEVSKAKQSDGKGMPDYEQNSPEDLVNGFSLPPAFGPDFRPGHSGNQLVDIILGFTTLYYTWERKKQGSDASLVLGSTAVAFVDIVDSSGVGWSGVLQGQDIHKFLDNITDNDLILEETTGHTVPGVISAPVEGGGKPEGSITGASTSSELPSGISANQVSGEKSHGNPNDNGGGGSVTPQQSQSTESNGTLLYHFVDAFGQEHDAQVQSHTTAEQWQCGICFNIANTPSTNCESQHIFCHICLNQWEKEQKRCPNCKVPSTGVSKVTLPFMLRSHQGISLYCPIPGCKTISTIGDIVDHLSSCPHYRLTCNNKGCGYKGVAEDFKSHPPVCPYKLITCNNHDCHSEFQQRCAQQHAETCEYRKVLCSLCNKEITHIFLEEHSNNCPYTKCDLCTACVHDTDLAAHILTHLSDGSCDHPLNTGVKRLAQAHLDAKESLQQLQATVASKMQDTPSSAKKYCSAPSDSSSAFSCAPGGSQSRHYRPELTIQNLERNAIVKELAAYWKRAGRFLGLSKEQLDNIAEKNLGSVEDCAFEMLETWLDTTDCSWDQIISVLRVLNNNYFAAQLERKLK